MAIAAAGAKTSVLVIDDEEGLRHYLQLMLQREGFAVEVAEDAAEALSRLESGSFDIAICDIRMPGELDGLGLLGALREKQIACDVVMMSAYGSRETALEAVRRGAYDYIDKPIQADDLLLTLHKLLERKRLHHENRRLRAALRGAHEDSGIISRSASFQDLLTRARRAAGVPANILLLGETGTGKTMLAKAIHRWSDRKDKPFRDVVVTSIPANLLESELFGYKKGTFTGATRDRIGLIQSADGGFLFLDEIGELPLELQAKLLRVLDDGRVRRLGDNEGKIIDVRIIAATNKDLEAEVAAGRFRQDLFYRLRVVDLVLPPLRERPEDIPHLVDSFLASFNSSFRTHIQGVKPDAMRALMAYPWPGNVRELRNAIESSVVQEIDDQLSLDSLPHQIRQDHGNSDTPCASEIYIPPDLMSIKAVTKEIEITLIKRALAETNGNKSAAARLLEISTRALLYKIKGYDLS